MRLALQRSGAALQRTPLELISFETLLKQLPILHEDDRREHPPHDCFPYFEQLGHECSCESDTYLLKRLRNNTG